VEEKVTGLIHTEPFDVFRFGEDQACRFLKKKGCRILERNYRTPQGEIDIIARTKDTLIFVEVKTRCSDRYAQPWEAVGFKKRKSLRTAAKIYLRERPPEKDMEVRFDIISIVLNDSLQAQIEWMQNAF